MSIPPLLSRTPPPICETSDDDDDFGHFVVNSELAVDISQAPDILDDYEKKMAKKCEDTTSDDSGLCMSSICQTQSPSDSSPLSSSFIHSSSIENTLLPEKNGFSYLTQENGNFENDPLPICPQDSLTTGSEAVIGIRKRSDADIEVDMPLRNSRLENEVFETNLIYDENLSSVEKNNIILNNASSHINTILNDASKEKSSEIKVEVTNIVCKSLNGSEKRNMIKNSNCYEEFSDFEGFSKKDDHLKEDLVRRMAVPDAFTSSENGTAHKYNVLEKNMLEVKPSVILIGTQIKECSESDPSVLTKNNFENTEEEFSDFQSNLCTSNICGQQTFINEVSCKIEDLWMDWLPRIELSPSMSIPFGEELNRSKVWINLCRFDSSPALSYQWTTSASNCKLLSALKIDSRNIFFGSWNKFKFPPTEGPAVLDSWKNISLKEKSKDIDITISKDPVPDAHFDWVGSGLVNPLDCVSTTLLDLQLLTFTGTGVSASKIMASSLLLSSHTHKGSRDDLNTINIPKLSSNAREVLLTLPDLSFMKKPFIVFPKYAV